MARARDSVIEQTLRRVVRDAFAKDEEISVKQARARVEKELGLEDGFFLTTLQWKQKSKSVIVAASAEEPEGDEPAAASKAKLNTSNPQSLGTTSQSIVKPANGGATVPRSRPAAGKGDKSKISDERVAEDDSGDEESYRPKADVSKTSTPNKPQQPKQVNGVKRKAEKGSSSNEDSESDSGSSSEADVDEDARQSKKARKDASSSSGKDSEDSSEEESEDDDDESQNGSEPAENVAATTTRAVPAIPPKAFKPPSGFALVESDLLTARLPLSSSSVEGKQMWQITAPSNLSFASIKSISLDSLRSGQTILTQNGIEYVLSENLDSAGDTCTVLLPSANAYQRVDHSIERTLRLQQKITLPNLTIRQADQNTGSSAAAEIRASPITSSRQQPKVLRMRYEPPGSGFGRPRIVGSESDSDEGGPTAVNVSATTGLTQDIDKMDVADDVAEHRSNKSKKKRKTKDSGESSRPTINGAKSHDTNSPKASKSIQPSLANGIPEEILSKEERKRLKRERKEAKQKAK